MERGEWMILFPKHKVIKYINKVLDKKKNTATGVEGTLLRSSRGGYVEFKSNDNSIIYTI